MCVSSASASPNLENDNTSGGSSSSNSANNETKRDTCCNERGVNWGVNVSRKVIVFSEVK